MYSTNILSCGNKKLYKVIVESLLFLLFLQLEEDASPSIEVCFTLWIIVAPVANTSM